MDTIKGLKERYEAIGNIEELLSIIAPECTDPKKYYKKYIEKESNYEVAKKRILLLEHLVYINESQKREVELEELRERRNRLLQDTDWTQLPDAPLSSEGKRRYRKYRFYLRELPTTYVGVKLDEKLMTYKQWESWIKEVRHTPGFTKYLP